MILIDVDGGEVTVLDGARETVGRCRAVIVEVAAETERKVNELLEAAGLRLARERKQRRGNRIYTRDAPARSPLGAGATNGAGVLPAATQAS